jgi:putative toxin-antitoxin system antitoxin component (TIGR02293 family)
MDAISVAKLLGGKQVLGRRVVNELELERCEREGFPLDVLEVLQRKAVLTAGDVYGWIIPRRTLSHRVRLNQRLSAEESNRVARVARIFALASETLGDDERATRWLRRPLRHFDDRTPMEMLATDVGTNQMETLLLRIAHGIAA